MASIRKRLAKGCVTYSYQVSFRRFKYEVKEFNISFATYEEACAFADEHEKHFIEDPEKYHAWKKRNHRALLKNCAETKKNLRDELK